MDRAIFPFDDIEIKPRPIFPAEEVPPLPESSPSVIVPPEPRPIAPRGIAEKDGPTQSELLLQAIITASRKETPNRGVLRVLCSRFSREHALDF
jgi:hypothetical protein